MQKSNRYFRRSSNRSITADIIDNEAVIVNLSSGTYYSLVDEGAEVWKSLGEGISFDGLVRQMQARYQGDHLEIENAIEKLLIELVDESLVQCEEVSCEGPDTGFEEIPGNSTRKFKAPILAKYTDMQELILMDPIHETNETGWPNAKV